MFKLSELRARRAQKAVQRFVAGVQQDLLTHSCKVYLSTDLRHSLIPPDRIAEFSNAFPDEVILIPLRTNGNIFALIAAHNPAEAWQAFVNITQDLVHIDAACLADVQAKADGIHAQLEADHKVSLPALIVTINS